MPTWELWTCGGCGGHEYEELSQCQRVCKFCHAMHDDVEEEIEEVRDDDWHRHNDYFYKGSELYNGDYFYKPNRPAATYYSAWTPYPEGAPLSEDKKDEIIASYIPDWNPYPREEEECRKLGVLDRIRAKLGIDTTP